MNYVADTDDRKINNYTHYGGFEYDRDSEKAKQNRYAKNIKSIESLQQSSLNGMTSDQSILEEDNTSEVQMSTPNSKKNIKLFINKTKKTRDHLSVHLQNQDLDSPAEKGGFFTFFF